MLELTKALSFTASVISLYWVGINALFVPGSRWQDRLFLAMARLALAAAICLLSGLIFRWPTPTNPDANQPLTSTLPIQLFFWATAAIAFFFITSWYLVCGAPTFTSHYPVCS